MSQPTRRDLLRTGSGLALGCLAGATGHPADEAPPARRSRVVLVRSADVVAKDGTIDGPQLGAMLDRGVATLLGTDEPDAAWRSLVKPDDVVGIKSNVWTYLPTPPALEAAIRDAVRGVGVAEDAVAIDDRGVRRNPVFERATALINVRPMRTHHWSGLGTCLKNVIMFVPRPPEYHGDACATLGAIWHLPAVKDKVRLNVLVMLTPQFHSIGPHSFSKRFVWTYGGLVLGTEPAPVDAVGARIIQAKRDTFFGERRPITPSPHHIAVAGERYGLGATAAADIDLVRLGWEEDLLI
jgi:hypothetical protein